MCTIPDNYLVREEKYWSACPPPPSFKHAPSVHMQDFTDARIYDQNAEPGYEIQRHSAKKHYRAWLKGTRKQHGWENFRVGQKPKPLPIQDRDTMIFNTNLPDKVDAISNTQRKINNKGILSQQPGMKIDDEDFRAKKFTVQMGQEIARRRTDLDLTQAELAKKINVEAGIIRDIERGDIVFFNPADTMVLSLAKALSMPCIKYI